MPHTGPILDGIGDTDYERYVRTAELLALQKPIDKLAHPEERLFQTMHQTAELWLKQVDYEIDRVAGMIEKGELHLAADLLERSILIVNLLREQIVILETMAPADYHVIRVTSLGKGSGQESPGFNRLLDVGRRIWPRYEAQLATHGLTPLDVEREPRAHYDFHRLQRAMIEYDSSFMKWRYVHMRLAMRIIGSRVKSLKGVPVTQLEGGTREPLFPRLWETISELTDQIRPEY